MQMNTIIRISLSGRFQKRWGSIFGGRFPWLRATPPCHFDEWRACPLARLAEREKARPEGACQPRTRRSQEAEPGGMRWACGQAESELRRSTLRLVASWLGCS